MVSYFIYKQNNELTPTLYALTDKKYLKDIFIDERDMNKFVVIKKNLKEKDYNRFIANHSGYILGIRSYETKNVDDELSVGKRCVAHILSTADEELNTYSRLDDVFSILAKYTEEISKTFNKDLLVSLNSLGYFTMYKFFHVTDEFVAGVQRFNTVNDFPLKPDSVSVFLELYGWSFKKD